MGDGRRRAVSSALLQHPNVSVLFPDYAGMMTYVLQGIQTAHKSSSVKAYLNFGGGTPFVKIQTADPGKSIVQSDIGGYPPWTGYLLFLQTARALEKQPRSRTTRRSARTGSSPRTTPLRSCRPAAGERAGSTASVSCSGCLTCRAAR